MNNIANYQNEPFPDTNNLFNRIIKIGEALKLGLSDPQKNILIKELFDIEKRGNRILYKLNAKVYDRSLVKIDGVNSNLINTKGLYLLSKFEKSSFEPVYIGISRNIPERLKGHLFRTDKGTSTFAWKMVLEDKKRKEIQGSPAELIKQKQHTYIKDLNLQVCPLDNNYELHMAEVFLAAYLKTYWNSFKTT